MTKTTTTESGPLDPIDAPDRQAAAGDDVRHDDAGADDAPASPRRRRKDATPAQRALALLVRREHSRPELRRKLLARGIDEADADAAVETMTEAGWQDDARFAASLARARVMNGYGPMRIEAELSTHGLAPEIVAGAFQSLEDDGDADWPARALDLLTRRFDAEVLAGDPAARRKAGDFLMRRGFGAGVLHSAIRQFCGR